MNKTIREASTYLSGLLPPDSHHYTGDDLLKLGMPDFIVRRIMLDVADRLVKSLSPPSCEWMDTERANVRLAWSQFVAAVKADAYLPRKHAADIIDNAVIETVELIIAPRRRVIEWLFGPSPELSIAHVRERAQYVTVNRYLTDALIRYMDRKDLENITKTAASEVIRTVDERYVYGFTPLNWGQLIDPLFQITRNRVDSELVHDFFIDKGFEALADLFPETASRIDRSQLIERLTIGPVTRQEKREQEQRQEQEQEREREQEQEQRQEQEDVVEEVPTLLATLGDDDVTEPQVAPDFNEAESGEDHPISPIVPIWQQFLSDIPEEDFADAEDGTMPLTGFLPDSEPQPAMVAKPLQSVGLPKAKLVDWLKIGEKTYIEGLFDGNEMSYFRTVSKLESCSDWDEVQPILKEWVRSADVDLHNAVLAQLVDQLQLYFSTNDS